jgi:hypothetical protein
MVGNDQAPESEEMLRMTSSSLETSGIWDNHHRGSVGNFLKEKVLESSDLSLDGLQSGRDFVIPNKQDQATAASDFELITWLVIKSGRTDG